jgi:hypothetical protein
LITSQDLLSAHRIKNTTRTSRRSMRWIT